MRNQPPRPLSAPIAEAECAPSCGIYHGPFPGANPEHGDRYPYGQAEAAPARRGQKENT